MPKFKVGDKVRINMSLPKNYIAPNGVKLNKEMVLDYGNRTLTIKEVCPKITSWDGSYIRQNYRLEETDNWNWVEEFFMLDVPLKPIIINGEKYA